MHYCKPKISLILLFPPQHFNSWLTVFQDIPENTVAPSKHFGARKVAKETVCFEKHFTNSELQVRGNAALAFTTAVDPANRSKNTTEP